MNDPAQDYDYQKYAILFVDDEEKIRKYFRRLYGGIFRIHEAGDGVEALTVFNEHADEIGVIVTDQRMPNETGVGFLSKVAERYPDVIKILSTAYSDLDAAIGSVNKGGIYRYITKPWEVTEFEVTLRRAMEFFMVRKERNVLMSAKLQALGNVLYASRLAAFALARMRFWGSAALATGVFLTYLVPESLLFIPMFQIVGALGLMNNTWSLVLLYPTLTVPFCTWIMIGYFSSIPKELDEAALIAALEAGTIYGAGLDVFEHEPRVPEKLLALPRVTVLPHVGSASQATRNAMGQLVVDNLKSWFESGKPITPVPETPWPPAK